MGGRAEGDVVVKKGVSEEGMLMDFSDVSSILNTVIHDVVDHAFLVYEEDQGYPHAPYWGMKDRADAFHSHSEPF